MRGADGLGTRMKLLVGRRLMNTSVCDVIMIDIFTRSSLTRIEANKVPRETIFLTSKLKSLRSYDKTLSDLRASLKRTGVPYFDLYLLHSAIGGPEVRKECWRACVDAQKEGLVKSIGVSNWGTKHIQELLDAGSVLPVVNQIDLHPFMRHPDIVKICQDNGILLEVSIVPFLRFLDSMERNEADGRHGDHWQEQ